jgi:hypothetical protein
MWCLSRFFPTFCRTKVPVATEIGSCAAPPMQRTRKFSVHPCASEHCVVKTDIILTFVFIDAGVD